MRDSPNRGEAIQLSGQFHLTVAELAGNEVLTEFLHELVLRSSLIIGLYTPTRNPPCKEHDHIEIVEAVARGDAKTAMAAMDQHLRDIEAALQFAPSEEERDLHAILTSRA